MPKVRYLNTGDDGPDDVLEEMAQTEEWRDAGAPSLADLWAERQGDGPPDRLLTIAEAARTVNVTYKTIWRRLPDLSALEPPGAWKVGRVWRIQPNALEALKAVRVAEKAAPRRRRSRAVKASASTRWEA